MNRCDAFLLVIGSGVAMMLAGQFAPAQVAGILFTVGAFGSIAGVGAAFAHGRSWMPEGGEDTPTLPSTWVEGE